MRHSGSYTNNYFQYVRPEQERRQRQSMRINEPLRTGGRALGTGTTMGRGNAPSQYHNHWYGGRQAMGLR